MGSEALVINGVIAESGIPWSLSALLDRIVLPAPLSFKNSITYEPLEEALARGLNAAATGHDARNLQTKLGMAMRAQEAIRPKDYEPTYMRTLNEQGANSRELVVGHELPRNQTKNLRHQELLP